MSIGIDFFIFNKQTDKLTHGNNYYNHFCSRLLAITLEHSLKVDKLIPALAMMALMWAIISLSHLPVFDVNTELKQLEPTHIDEILLHHLGKTAEIIIFLLGA